MAAVLLTECENCDLFGKKQGTFIVCRKYPDISVMVRSYHANWEDGFKNGTLIVDCPR